GAKPTAVPVRQAASSVVNTPVAPSEAGRSGRGAPARLPSLPGARLQRPPRLSFALQCLDALGVEPRVHLAPRLVLAPAPGRLHRGAGQERALEEVQREPDGGVLHRLVVGLADRIA